MYESYSLNVQHLYSKIFNKVHIRSYFVLLEKTQNNKEKNTETRSGDIFLHLIERFFFLIFHTFFFIIIIFT